MKLIAVLLVAVACASAQDSFPFWGRREYERTPLGDSIDKTTLKLLKEMYNAGTEKNVIASPLGIDILLSIYNEGAGPQSQQEIGAFLGNPDQKKLSSDYSGISNYFAHLNPDFLTMANKMYVGDGFDVVEAFDAAVRSYDSEVEKINFGDSQKAADTINAWADEKTKGHIKTPVSADDLGPDVVAALFNVIFFQGHWHVPFNASNTKDEDFHVDKNMVVKKPTMKLLQSLFYAESEDLGAKLVELPYKEADFRMVIVLPNEIDGLPSVLDKAEKKGLLEDVFRLAPAGADVDFSIPKFEIKSKHDLNTILPKVGVSKIFEEPAAGIVKGPPVKVSKAFQEAFVKVDEEGATAGAFTGAVAVFASSLATPPPPIKLPVDHPFLFTILYQDKVLFAGVYSH